MNCRHTWNAVRYQSEVHPHLAWTRYTGLHALHRDYHAEWRGYYQGHIRTRAKHGLSCRLLLCGLAVRERIARRVIITVCRRRWLGPEAAEAIRRAIAAGEV